MLIPEGFKEATLLKYPPLLEFYNRVGSTPLIEIDTPAGHGRIFAKCEWENPASTIKARVALAMIWNLLDRLPEISKDTTILEYSGGSLSLAIAELCHNLGVKCVLTLSESSSKHLIQSLYNYGAVVHLVEKELGFWGVMEKGKQLKAENPHWHFLYQHENESNVRFHRDVTAREILNEIDFVPDAWVASIGTGGTLSGVYAGLKAEFPELQLFATTPTEMPYGTQEAPNALPKFAGSGGLGLGRKQRFVAEIDNEVVEHYLYSYPETKEEMYNFYVQTGNIIGSSSAANLLAAYDLAAKLGPDSHIVTIFPARAFEEETREMLQRAALASAQPLK